ncbi:MAG: amidohydrolase family protein [Planctomycetales bacterium]
MPSMRSPLLLLLAMPWVVLAAFPLSAAEPEAPLYTSPYRIINMHRHSYTASEKYVETELEVMDRVGIDAMVILLLGQDGTDPRFPRWMELQKKYSDRLAVFGSVDFGGVKKPTFFQDIVRDIEYQHKLGIQGMKLWKDLGMSIKDAEGKLLKADDPRLDPMWAKMAELELPVVFHCADPKEYWFPRTYHSFHYGTGAPQFYEDPDMPSWEELMRQRDHVLEKHPDLVMIGAHFGSLTFDLERLAATFDKHPNFHVECAARLRILGRLNPQAVRDFFVKYQDRILFGSDSDILSGADATNEKEVRQWQDKAARFLSRYLEYFETDRPGLIEPYQNPQSWLRISGAKLPPEVLEKFYHGNAERLIPGLRPKGGNP